MLVCVDRCNLEEFGHDRIGSLYQFVESSHKNLLYYGKMEKKPDIEAGSFSEHCQFCLSSSVDTFAQIGQRMNTNCQLVLKMVYLRSEMVKF